MRIIRLPVGVTWDPNTAGLNLTFSNGNKDVLKAQTVPFAWSNVIATLSHSTGKWYFEETIVSTSQAIEFGVVTSGGNNNAAFSGFGATAFSYEISSQAYRITSTGSTTGDSITPTVVQGDIIGFAMDFDVGFIWMSQNGSFTAFSTGASPSGGVHPCGSFTANTPLFPAVAIATNNTGNADILLAASGTYVNSPPSGFSSWS